MNIAYARHELGAGIVHMGVGAFHRAHQAVYTDALLKQYGGDWRIIGVSLRRPDVRDALREKDFAYTLAVFRGDAAELHHIGALQQVLVAPEGPQAVIKALAAPATRVITLTITEKGYCLRPASGALDNQHPDIVHDLAHLHAPRSAIGYLVAAMAARRAAEAGGVTLLSCDNLSSNGHKLRAAVIEFAELVDPALSTWIDETCAFPCSMVDRIVPATTTEDIQRVASMQGFIDAGLVVTEPFTQWVIERRFAGDVPPWNEVGAEFVDDVEPFEQMKLRLLNASHSTMAYLGALAGYETVADVVEDAAFVPLLRQLMADEMAPTLSGLGDFNLEAYQTQLIERFQNRSLHHLTRQIAMDGSQKIPQRLLPAIAERLFRGESVEASALGVAAWIRYTMGVDEQGREYQVQDPLATAFFDLYQSAQGDADKYLQRLLSLEGLFPATLQNDIEFSEQLRYWLGRLLSVGAQETVHARWGGAQLNNTNEGVA